MTLMKTIPTIVSSFKESFGALKDKSAQESISRTEHDLSMKVVWYASLELVILMMVIPQIPGDSLLQKLLIGIFVVIFCVFLVTV